MLELACGTGIWSEKLLPFASRLTAVDGSPEMLAIAAARLRSTRVDFIEANLFDWKASGQFDTVFFGFWLSHVPPAAIRGILGIDLHGCLAPGGRVFFVDSRRDSTSTALDHRLPEEDTIVLRRRLNDGREFQVLQKPFTIRSN